MHKSAIKRPPTVAASPPRLSNWTTSLCQGQILPYNSPNQKTRRKVPRTIRDHCSSRYTLHHTPPPDAMRTVHPVFHLSMIEPFTPSTIPNRTQEPPAAIEVEGDLEYEIAEILDSKLDRRRRCKLLYLVKWVGYEGTDEETSWLPADELTHAPDLVADFHKAYPDKPAP
jgi:hypothetical protein